VVAETKLLYTLHWILLDSAEVQNNNNNNNFNNVENVGGLFHLSLDKTDQWILVG